MKIQLDTDQKIIRIEESVNIGDLINKLKKLLPNKLWKEFKLETNTKIINWGSPIIIEPYRPYNHWLYPWYGSGTVYCNGNAHTTNKIDNEGNCSITVSGCTLTNKESDLFTLTSGTFNVEM